MLVPAWSASCTQARCVQLASDVSVAQIYVEIERARLTRQLAAIQEADGDVATAADTLQEVAVVRPAASPLCLPQLKQLVTRSPCVPFCVLLPGQARRGEQQKQPAGCKLR